MVDFDKRARSAAWIAAIDLTFADWLMVGFPGRRGRGPGWEGGER